MRKSLVFFIVTIIALLISLASICYIIVSKHHTQNLHYKIADAAVDYFGDGRYQIMEYDWGEYYLQDQENPLGGFIGKIKSYKVVGTKVYFVHFAGFSILDYKKNSLKQYIDFNKYTKSDLRLYKETVSLVNKDNFGEKWIVLKKYEDFTPKEKEIFDQLRNKTINK